ncbi:hypothetical protein OHA40_19165 [Nocardia sp. NBC_00508]|uniref:hypothetical protein n=1 Tax=Nocardia sp. NBC_00508 TaxID=2975992 RepID=UPI002E813188|nr:hypothetical protein [Nocardia sp. NBC_00508]WUD63864.1 hypothetical protein OHA40_19165 [Nocardia sp. NBC_00508]
MSELELDPDKTREMAGIVRGHADTIRQLIPLASGVVAVGMMQDSQVADSVDQIARALNNVVDYHTKRLIDFADVTDTAVVEFVNRDQLWATALREAGQR